MVEQDLVTPLFVEDTTVSPQRTRWFPAWVWWGRSLTGELLVCRWAIARWVVVTGGLFISDEAGGLIQIGETTHEVRRELRAMTPGNILLCDIASDCCLIPKEENIT